MSGMHRWTFVSLVLLGAAAVTLGAGDVTIERLNNADKEPENWPIYGGTYRSLRYSPLDQVTSDATSLGALIETRTEPMDKAPARSLWK